MVLEISRIWSFGSIPGFPGSFESERLSTGSLAVEFIYNDQTIFSINIIKEERRKYGMGLFHLHFKPHKIWVLVPIIIFYCMVTVKMFPILTS